MKTNHLIKGRLAEEQALEYLLTQELQLVCRNYYCKNGEVDLVMRDKEDLVFIEVRYRTQSNFADAAASITRAKQLKIIRAAKHFLQKHQLTYSTYSRFDVIAIDYKDHQSQLKWIKNAFYAE